MIDAHASPGLHRIIEHHMPLEFPDPMYDEMHFDNERRFITWREDKENGWHY